MSHEDPNTYVATVNVRDDFFNDPFFKDWWADFESPISVIDNAQESGSVSCKIKINLILCSFLFQ